VGRSPGWGTAATTATVRDAAGGEQLGRRDGLDRDAPGAQRRVPPCHVSTPPGGAAAEPGHDRAIVLAESVVDGAARLPRGAHRRRGLLVVGGCDHLHARLRAHDGEVFHGVVREPLRAVLEAAPDADDAHGEAVPDGAVANELVRPQRGEGGDRVHERHEAGLGEAGGDADHVLFGDPGVDEAAREAVAKGFERHEPEIAGEQYDPLVGSREFGQRADEGSAHDSVAPSSCIACR
jgi:hypothetical protein